MTHAADASGLFLSFLQDRGIPFQNTAPGLVVHGDIELKYAGIRHLPEDLTIRGCLDLRGSDIGQLPDRLVVTRDLFAEDTRLSSLPQDLSVGHDVILRNSRVESLPAGFQVRGFLSLSNTPIQVLPEGLDVGGDLTLIGSGVLRLPASLRVGGMIVPPLGLLDLRAFMATQHQEVVLSRTGSHHHALALRAALEPFPDLVRILASLRPATRLILRPDGQGGCTVFLEPIM